VVRGSVQEIKKTKGHKKFVIYPSGTHTLKPHPSKAPAGVAKQKFKKGLKATQGGGDEI